MKYFFTILLSSFLCTSYSDAQMPAYAGIPGPENVLVVYRSHNPNDPSDSLGLISEQIKNYYVNARNIQSENIIFPGLRFPDTTFTIDGVTHSVGLAQSTDIIRDFDNDASQTGTATEHAWKYFYTFMAQPILNYLTTHNLTDQIRYIVLCKGVPMKIQAAGDYPTVEGNIGIDVSELSQSF